MYKIGFVVFIVVITLSLVTCSSDPLAVDVSGSDVDIECHRMEQELFQDGLTDIDGLNRKLLEKYGFLYESFIAKMIVEGSAHDPAIGVRLSQFRKDSVIRSIYRDIDAEFKDFSAYEKRFEKAFAYYHYYFPDSSLPDLVTFYSNFNAKIFPMENTLAIGLDMYLGPENRSVKRIPIDVLPQFIKNDMDKRYMVADGMKYWLLNRFYDEKAGDDFVSKIIELGKIMYLLDAVLPDVSDDVKINYTPEELNWVQNNENNIWKTLVDDEVLYTKNPMTINQYIVDGPFTKGLPNESPSKVGIWVGWQIVRDYVDENDVDVLSLLKEKNSLKILRAYKHGNR
ncbi:MAG: hypothetical protein N4A35_02270 [Flavobacteriales bacterium]|jgi:hypothetical protein|nr:hypothetical protein [Flavobacteriales bacterium]